MHGKPENATTPLVEIVDLLFTGETALLAFPAERVLIARDGYERYIDGKLAESDRLASHLSPGVEEAWDALTAEREPRRLRTAEGSGSHPGGGWLLAIESVDLDDGRRLYVERRSGDVPDPGVFLIAATREPGAAADTELLSGSRRPQPPIKPTKCCGGQTELLGTESSGTFRAEASRCPTCGTIHWSTTRIDGQNFWVGAMGQHTHDLRRRLAVRLGLDPGG